jgi:hypothetical protein
LVEAADKFDLSGLLAKCLEMFKNQTNNDNATDVLILAGKHGLEDFKYAAINKNTFNRTILMTDSVFRTKMMDQPKTLLLLYD